MFAASLYSLAEVAFVPSHYPVTRATIDEYANVSAENRRSNGTKRAVLDKRWLTVMMCQVFGLGSVNRPGCSLRAPSSGRPGLRAMKESRCCIGDPVVLLALERIE